LLANLTNPEHPFASKLAPTKAGGTFSHAAGIEASVRNTRQGLMTVSVDG
jgi:membrane-associated HD superfamily phosphohydrolase